MSTWILQHFLNPALFWPGVALLAAPVIIHLINRLRYRRVRFAAMEFLLASQRRNRRRILFEQILLLLLRMALIALLVALVGRLILDPEELSLFQGAKSHHVVILDDSLSMHDREGEATAFDSAKALIRRLIAEGARRPGTQVFSLILMTEPDQSVFGLSERGIDTNLLNEVADRLESLNCSHQAADPALAIDAALNRLSGDRTAVKHVHILSDFRQQDWIENQAAERLAALEKAKVKVNLVRCISDTHENLAVSDLGGAVEVAAAGVPVTLTTKVRNWGTRDARDVQATVLVDGVRLPRTIDFQTIPAGEEVARNFDVIFDTPQPHQVRLRLEEDALEEDNDRFLAVDVPESNPVLIVDGSPAAEQAQYVADALAADKSVTGFEPDTRSPEDLRRTPLERYDLIYLINVGELAPDAIASLQSYVQQGGGLIWYLGDAVRPTFYNTQLYDAEGGLFPVKLGTAPVRNLAATTDDVPPSIQVKDQPPFQVFTSSEVPILDLVLVNLYYPIETPPGQRPVMLPDASVLATLGGAPLMLEHPYGQGRIFTALTSAGPLKNPEGVTWNNWANGPAGFSFVVLQLELAKRFIRKNSRFPILPTGTPIELEFDQAEYSPEVQITTPDDQMTLLQAVPVKADDEAEAGSAANSGDTANGNTTVTTTFRDTDLPGVYTALLTSYNDQSLTKAYALNVPAEEGALEVAPDDELLDAIGPQTQAKIHPAGSFDWIRSESPGSEIRWFLLVALALFCIGEQLLASRLTYQGQ